MQMRNTYEITFTFEFFDDIITYKTVRECTSENAIISYANEWVKKFGSKYGECISIEICECVKVKYPIFLNMKGR